MSRTRKIPLFGELNLPEYETPFSGEDLEKEVALWCALLGRFNQKDVLSRVREYLSESREVNLPENRIREKLKTFLKKEKIPYQGTEYVICGEKSLAILRSFSPEEVRERVFFVRKRIRSENLPYSIREGQILSRGLLFTPELLSEVEERFHGWSEPLRELGESLPLFPDLLKNISREILLVVLEEVLYQAFARAEGRLPLWLETLEKDFPYQDEDFVWLFFQGALLAGRKNMAQKLREKIETPWRRAYAEALLKFLSGESYLSALKEAEEFFRTGSRRKYFLPDGPLGLLAPLMAFLSRDPERQASVAPQWSHLSRRVPENWREEVAPLGRFLRSLTENKIIFLSWEEPFSLEGLVFLWLEALSEDPFPLFRPEGASELARELEKTGHLLWALEILGSLSRKHAAFRPEVERLVERTGFRPIVERFFEEPSWEERLARLEKLLEFETSKGQEEGKRLVWFLKLTEYGFSLEPVEQKRLAPGLWSKGRKVALKRLYEDKYPLPNEHDRRIVRHIQEEIVGYGRWRKVNYTFRPEVLEALVGHPLIFDARTGEHLEVEKLRPKLLVERLPEGLRLRVKPRVSPENEWHLFREGSRLRILRLNEPLKEILFLLGGDGLVVPYEAEERLQRLLPGLGRWLEVEAEVALAEGREVPPEKKLGLFLKPMAEGLKLTVRSLPLGEEGPRFVPGRGREEVLTRVGEEVLRTRRDLSTERERFRDLEKKLREIESLERLEEGEWLAPDLPSALELLEALSGLSGEAYRILWPEGERLRVEPITEVPEVRVLTAGEWFEVEGRLRLPEGEMDLKEILSGLREGRGRFVPLEEGRFLALKEEIYRSLRELAELAEIRKNRARIHPLKALALREEGLRIEGDEGWREFRRRLETVFDENPDPPSGLRAELRPYQLEGYRWLWRLYRLGFGGCLADDMGLGKTVQTLALLLAAAEAGPSLVVAPASVLSVWQEEARKFAPDLRLIPLAEVESRSAALEKASPGEVFLVSYGLLQQEETAELLRKVAWNVVVLDEAQHIKNYRTKRARHAYALSARFRLATTGTPVENRLEELWALFRFLNPGLLGSYEEFRKRFVIPIEKEKDSEARRRLRRIIKPFLLRRTKAEVLEELPPKTEVTVPVVLSSEEKRHYETLRLKALQEIEAADRPEKKRFTILSQLTRLRLFCASPRLVFPEEDLPESKIEALLELLEEALSAGHRVLVFSQFVKFLHRLEETLREKGIGYLSLYGSTPSAERARRVEDFRRGAARVFLLSLKAGGFGLNLTVADHVILCDPWWNPAVELQATDRIHRLGQSRPVTVYRLVTRDTVEEKVQTLQQEKRELAAELLSETGPPTALDWESLLELLR